MRAMGSEGSPSARVRIMSTVRVCVIDASHVCVRVCCPCECQRQVYSARQVFLPCPSTTQPSILWVPLRLPCLDKLTHNFTELLGFRVNPLWCKKYREQLHVLNSRFYQKLSVKCRNSIWSERESRSLNASEVVTALRGPGIQGRDLT
ncbi:hypothetical protein E2C01_018114 [Portunus trituberculatus]|uniref:Uncharacterized protein n=1 Tax=Portunus trituberculatus TaxID=210409 RepID=A0A5B7DVJ9_PORTR|nr:hypothetical protein [Portunus trituberculatus]